MLYELNIYFLNKALVKMQAVFAKGCRLVLNEKINVELNKQICQEQSGSITINGEENSNSYRSPHGVY